MNKIGKFNIILIISFSMLSLIFSCKRKDEEEEPKIETNYPPHIENIIATKCATSGCHNDKSKDAAAGLSLTTWDRMFEGSNGGAVVIPFRPDFSTLIYYVNHDSLLSYLQLSPTMPIGGAPLSLGELQMLRDWIANGAPDKNGLVKFSDDPNRQKYYVANQGCDAVTVFDSKSMLAMRVVDVGKSPLIESPHMIKVSYDNQYWYTCFLGGTVFQKYSTLDNSFVGEVNIGSGSWNTFSISSDNLKAYIIDFANGKIAVVDVNAMTVQFLNGFGTPHGSALNFTNDTLYMTAQLGSYLFKIPVNDVANFEIIDLEGNFPFSGGELEPHEVALSPDGLKYFVTCQKSNEVRVVEVGTDDVVAAIPVGAFPQEMAFSNNQPYLFVTCMDASNPDPFKKSAVAIINYQTNTLIKTIYAGYQSHGVVVDDYNNRVYISNRNINSTGPAPHHSSLCGGRNGYISAIDMNTLEVIPGSNTEVSVDPYGIGITH